MGEKWFNITFYVVAYLIILSVHREYINYIILIKWKEKGEAGILHIMCLIYCLAVSQWREPHYTSLIVYTFLCLWPLETYCTLMQRIWYTMEFKSTMHDTEKKKNIDRKGFDLKTQKMDSHDMMTISNDAKISKQHQPSGTATSKGKSKAGRQFQEESKSFWKTLYFWSTHKHIHTLQKYRQHKKYPTLYSSATTSHIIFCFCRCSPPSS